MRIEQHNLTLLSKKGEVTILENPQGENKTIVAVKARGNVLTLQGSSKNQLIAELLQIVQNWPDIN